jgi:hypothetical protein
VGQVISWLPAAARPNIGNGAKTAAQQPAHYWNKGRPSRGRPILVSVVSPTGRRLAASPSPVREPEVVRPLDPAFAAELIEATTGLPLDGGVSGDASC